MKTLKDLFEHQLKDLYNAEMQQIETLPKIIQAVSDDKLKELLENHLSKTESHKQTLANICEEIGISPTGEKCKAMEGLIKEAKGFLEEDAADDVRDAGIIAEAQRIDHYEITGYGTIIRYAKELGHNEIADKLKTLLDEEYESDEKMTDMAEDRLNSKAM